MALLRGAWVPKKNRVGGRSAAWWPGLAGVALLAGVAQAQTIASSARQMSARSLKWDVYYQGTQGQDLNFKQTTSGSCTGGGGINPSFACGSSGNVPASIDAGAIILQVTYQPWENLQYYAGLGAGNLTMSVSSVSARNVLTGDRPGFLYHVGVRSVIIPDTIAGPGVAIDGRIGWQRYHFNEIHPFTAGAGQIDQRLDIYQYQIAVETSHRFVFSDPQWSVEPYGGVKWLRSHAYLKDLQAGGRTGGIQDTFTPFVGLVVPMTEHESLTAEASFVNGIQYSAGLQVRF